MQKMVIALGMAMMTHLVISMHTDFFWGMTDPIGPYPRIPDKEKLKKEMAYAEEMKKYYTAPKDFFF